MSIEITDRRTSSDTARHAQRAAIREEAGRLQFEKDKIPTLESVLRESDERLEVATSEHEAATTPLQTELRSLEEAAIERIGKRDPPDEEADARRVELLREIAACNADLEEAAEREKKHREPIEQEVWRLRNQVGDPAAILQRLAGPAVADRQLLQQQFIAQQNIKWGQARLKAAQGALKIVAFNVREIKARRMSGDLPVEQRKVENWQAELDAARQASADAAEESKGIHHQMLQE